MKIYIKCPNCGKEFETSEGKRGLRQTYCCRECYEEHKGIGKKKYANCVVCGKKFELIHGKAAMVCSKECLGKLRSQMFSKSIIHVCKNCGKKFKRRYETETQEFCCRKCYWEYRRAHKDDKYVDVFKDRKDSTHEIRKCEMCGKEFKVYKKIKKRFCSDECRVRYQNTEEFKNKRISTMLKKYGKKSAGNGVSAKRIKEYEKNRKEKYENLCKKSNLELIDYVEKHVLLVKCKKCGKEFLTNNLSYLPYESIPCKYCSDEYKDYKPAIKIYNLLDKLNIEFIKNDRTIIHPYELDIYVPKFNLAFEINGNFWHSELAGKDKYYHINKTILSNKNGVRLIHIFEDEIVNKWKIVESRIKSILNLNNKLYARACEVVQLNFNEKREFMNENHIQGDTNSSINIGLKYSGEIVAAITFSRERTNSNKNNYELMRYASKCGYNVIGGFGKLLSYFIKENNPQSIKTFCDIRWAGIDASLIIFNKFGFEVSKFLKPNYWYMHKTDMLNRKNSNGFTKQIILKKYPNLDSNKSEWDLMKELGYNRIWDCGNIKFLWKKV